MKLNIRENYKRGKTDIFPIHDRVKSHVFNEGEELEAHMLDAVMRVADKNGVNINTVNHLFPAILKMLDSKCSWVTES